MKPLPCAALIVLLLVAGKAVQAEPPGPEIWEHAIANFEAADKTNAPDQGGIEFIGSSTIARWRTLQPDFRGQPVFNRGFGGSQISDAVYFADRIVIPYAPKMIFLRSGGNDLWAGKTPETVFADFRDFVDRVHAQLPGTEIVFISLSPSVARWKQHEKELAVNHLAKNFAAQTPHVTYIETYDLPLGANGQPRKELFVSDGLHFNATGYKLLAERVRPFLPDDKK